MKYDYFGNLRLHAMPVAARLGQDLRLWQLLIPIMLVFFTAVGLSAYGDAQQVIERLESFEASAWLTALALSGLSFALRAARFQLYLRGAGIRIAGGEATLVFFAGMSMAITPGRLGEVIKPLMLKWSRGVPIMRALPVVVLERATDLVALLLLTAWGGCLLPGGTVLACICVALAVSVGCMFGSPRVTLAVYRLILRVPFVRKRAQRVDPLVSSLAGVSQQRLLTAGTAIALLAWFCQVVGLQQIVHGLPGTQITLQASAFACCAPLIAGVAALVPGGLGVTEATMTGALRAIGGSWSTAASAVAVTALVRLVTFWFAVALGALAFLLHRRWLECTPTKPET